VIKVCVVVVVVAAVVVVVVHKLLTKSIVLANMVVSLGW
jgi:hypothetical protein